MLQNYVADHITSLPYRVSVSSTADIITQVFSEYASFTWSLVGGLGYHSQIAIRLTQNDSLFSISMQIDALVSKTSSAFFTFKLYDTDTLIEAGDSKVDSMNEFSFLPTNTIYHSDTQRRVVFNTSHRFLVQFPDTTKKYHYLIIESASLDDLVFANVQCRSHVSDYKFFNPAK